MSVPVLEDVCRNKKVKAPNDLDNERQKQLLDTKYLFHIKSVPVHWAGTRDNMA